MKILDGRIYNRSAVFSLDLLIKGEKMKKNYINEVIQAMIPHLNCQQIKKLNEVLVSSLCGKDIVSTIDKDCNCNDLINKFISAKRVEGLSEKSLHYYKMTIEAMHKKINKQIQNISTENLRDYLSNYQEKNKSSRVTIDNIRRILSTYFSWLEDENYLMKSPIRRIHKIKSTCTVKEIYSDEALEKMRDNCSTLRDLAIIDMLASTGMRVGELVLLNKESVNFFERECKVLGKGNKERIVYFDARTKIHLQDYLKSRNDDNCALFVGLNAPFNRLTIGAVELRIRHLGKKLEIKKAHPHKFRRSLATKAIDKGMPIEQLQVLLGHKRIDTTLQYAMVNQANVKASHKKYIG